jgi:hypothetical protein
MIYLDKEGYMRIISQFKDYYDSAASYGQDMETIFNRVRSVVSYDPNALNKFDHKTKRKTIYKHTRDINKNGYTYDCSKLVLGFCGKIIPFVKVSKREAGNYMDAATEDVFYSHDEFIAYLKKEDLKENSFEERFWYSKDGDFWGKNDWSYLVDLFRLHKTPIFLYGNVDDLLTHDEKHDLKKYFNLIINPKLKEIKYQAEMDAATTFQEVFMYIAGVLGSVEKEMINISDKDKIKQHGFDPKYGFRKMPGNGNS